MTITIDLPPEVADALAHKAAQERRDSEEGAINRAPTRSPFLSREAASISE